MERAPNHDDAQLLLRLYDLRREEKLRAARAWFVSNFKVKTFEEWQTLCAPGSETNAYYRMVTTYWDMACSFVASGVLHPDLFIQNNLEHLVVWERVQAIVPEMRRVNKSPVVLRNLEEVAGRAAKWLDQQAPGTYAGFVERFRP